MAAGLSRLSSGASGHSVTLKYTVMPCLSYFCKMENIFAELLVRTYFVTEDRTIEVRPTNPKITAVIQARF